MPTSRLLPEGNHAPACFLQGLHLAAKHLQVLWLQHQHAPLHLRIVQCNLPCQTTPDHYTGVYILHSAGLCLQSGRLELTSLQRHCSAYSRRSLRPMQGAKHALALCKL